MPLKPGDTFFMGGTGGAKDPAKAHLMVCLLPLTLKGNSLIVPIITKHHYSDEACVLQKGDHDFITRESCACYDQVKCLSAAAADKQIAEGGIVLQKPVSAELLLRLQVGLMKSDETVGWVLAEATATGLAKYLKENGHT